MTRTRTTRTAVTIALAALLLAGCAPSGQPGEVAACERWKAAAEAWRADKGSPGDERFEAMMSTADAAEPGAVRTAMKGALEWPLDQSVRLERMGYVRVACAAVGVDSRIGLA